MNGKKQKPLEPLASAKQALQNCISSCKEAYEHFSETGHQFPDPSLKGKLEQCLHTCDTTLKDLESSQELNALKIEHCADVCAKCAILCEQSPDLYYIKVREIPEKRKKNRKIGDLPGISINMS